MDHKRYLKLKGRHIGHQKAATKDDNKIRNTGHGD